MESSYRKIIQKHVYDILSHKYGLILVVLGVFLVALSALHFGETALEWSREKYAAVFNSFSDNIGGRSFRQRLCLPVPIDVVYTWVNGSDPTLISELRQVRMEMEKELNVSREEKCSFSNCLPTLKVVLEPVLPTDMNLTQFKTAFPAFSEVKDMYTVTSPADDKLKFTVLVFENDTYVKEVVNKDLDVHGNKTRVKRAYITSDWTVQHSILLHDIIIMSGFPHELDVDSLRLKMPEKFQTESVITKISLHTDRGIAVLYVPKKADFDELVDIKNFTIDGKEPTLNAANLIWELKDYSQDEDLSSSRFEDNEELRYSLRSVEKYAPWVRHIYIVTNGQIPYWLDMESSRISIVTHHEIFSNKSHLPTFSSPAIEAHLHKIPGLSDKFIYLNDDVMFGKDVWPDDFFTYSTGQKVYLTWPVPNCNEGCPSTWIKDGYCDKACNNSECEWDAGDCDGSKNAINFGAGYHHALSDSHLQGLAYCSSGCANNWIADKYCDTACNVEVCGFDAGDCGVTNFDKLYGMDFSLNKTHYTLPPGVKMAYFNMTNLLGKDGMITNAYYNDSAIYRQVAVANKFKVMTIVLQSGHNQTTLTFFIEGHQGSNEKRFQHNFTVTVDTNKTQREDSQSVGPAKNETQRADDKDSLEEPLIFQEMEPREQRPHFNMADRLLVTDVQIPVRFDRNFTNLKLSAPLRQQVDNLIRELQEGDITDLGFGIERTKLYKKYLYENDHPEKVIPPAAALHAKQLDMESHFEKYLKKQILGTKETHDTKKKKEHLMGRTSHAKQPHHDQKPPLNLNKSPYDTKKGHRKLLNIDVLEGLEKKEGLSQIQDDMGDSEFLKDVAIGTEVGNPGAFPWERNNSLEQLQREKEKLLKTGDYVAGSRSNRNLLDTFGDSLRHVNRIYNRAFGFGQRKVPAHMPHMIDKHVMSEMQERFANDWDETSSHKVRHVRDMQFAFSYFYYLLGVMEDVTPEQIFDNVDTDHSRVLSDREIRTLAAQIFELPLYLETLQGLEAMIINCSHQVPADQQMELPPPTTEVYYDAAMPQLTKKLFLNCTHLTKLVMEKFKPKPKYKYTILDDEEVVFKMIKSNVSTVVAQLDDIRKNNKKFICLNDNIEHGTEDAKTVKAILQDYYESMFPIPSQFELPRDYRNRFLHTDDLREWKKYRDWLKFWTHLALVILILFTVGSFFGDKIDAVRRRLSRLHQRIRNSSSSASSTSRVQDAIINV